MRYLIISDPHANWPALEAVLADAEGEYGQIVCCGDLVGYNPDPGRVLDWTLANCAATVRGNHDKVVSGLESLEWFNEVAQTAARWTVSQLDPEQVSALRDLPAGPLQLEHFHIWHGSPRDEDEYVVSLNEATPLFEYLRLPVAFFGHTHVQGVYFAKQQKIGARAPVPRQERESAIELEPDLLYLINPGSVGQPRDGDPRAAYAIFDTDAKVVYLRRVAYPVAATAEQIRKAGLPEILAARLFQGM